MSTTTAIAATSLSELNELAANPPQYPHNPTEQQREPLTLYISRVPGTRDVILSTLKPQRKNVTAEDIANALYYVHLDLPSDSLLVSPPSGRDVANSSPRSSFDQPRSSPIHRKPLPAKLPGPDTNETVPVSPTLSRPTSRSLYEPQPPQLPPRQVLSQDVPPIQPPRPPRQPWVPPGFRLDEDHQFEAVKTPEVVTTVEVAQSPPSPAVPLRPRPSISRKPVGPRTVGNGNGNGNGNPQDTRPIGLPTTTSNSSLASYSSQTAIDPQKQQQHQQQQQQQQQRPLSPLSPRSPVFVPFQLTLIRRDPSSNHQWNVGKISSLQVIDPPASSLGPPDRLDASATARDQQQQQQQQQQPQATISIRLDSSGYAKFRGFPTRRNVETASRDMNAVLQDLAREGRPEPRDESGFSRQVVMSYGKSWTANLRNAFRRHDRSSSDTTGLDVDAESQQQQQQQQKRQRPVSHMPASDTTAVALPQPLITRPGPGLKPRGYVFASPWDGQCEFRTGNGGRSLKCRHYLHTDGGGSGGGEGGGGGGRSAGFNPLVLAQNIRDGQSVTAAAVSAAGGRSAGGSFTDAITGAAPVSELRFNLPSSDVLRGGKAEDGSGCSRPDLYGWRYHRRSTSSDDGEADDYEEDDDETLAVAMGREPAGGGNRGKRAKLGKLIIYNEGFKMLDLIVAANIGMWWVSWDKSF